MIATPFDNLTLIDFHSSNIPKPKIEILNGILSFSKELRVRYLNLIEYAKLADNKFERMIRHNNTSPIILSNIEILLNQSETLGPVLAYQDLIRTLNSHGRSLIMYGLRIPQYYRIRFYRNIIVEHWDMYISKSCQGITGWSTKRDKITVPVHSLIANMPDPGKKNWHIILKYLHNIGIKNTMTWEDTINYEKYTENIWNILEQIDDQLNTDKKTKKISSKLIDMLYDYALPIPVSDVEAYASELSNYLEKSINTIIQ